MQLSAAYPPLSKGTSTDQSFLVFNRPHSSCIGACPSPTQDRPPPQSFPCSVGSTQRSTPHEDFPVYLIPSWCLSSPYHITTNSLLHLLTVDNDLVSYLSLSVHTRLGVVWRNSLWFSCSVLTAVPGMQREHTQTLQKKWIKWLMKSSSISSCRSRIFKNLNGQW